ncbi:hypothetical protein BCR33DRAFT_755053 [Rhizoclosmatium globosum]|uniref:non-specific serine/threonine protein kinase n=1 Tax=Rhizoclosmatium globosum TaxID=329046 RepID=A0A1Y2BEW3_9FUNG|nr:hypothetical protein BCR33DRAFT_755053 [Rhizoclosmatium globosum]|eukprot:ORY32997.1 hypothetical protein BCR33DRAFT_755053 [Rhizoclosmatium globosum]
MQPPATWNPSKTTQERAAVAKLRLEYFYETTVTECKERDLRCKDLEARMFSEKWSDERKALQLLSLGRKESEFLRLRRTRLTAADFSTLKVIGRVRLVQKLDSGKIYAMKTLKKSEMLKKSQLAHVKAERDVLAESANTPWVVQLFYSFQIQYFTADSIVLTRTIEYDVFPEDVTRFYMAEVVEAPCNGLPQNSRNSLLHERWPLRTIQRIINPNHNPPSKNIDLSFSRKERIETWKRNRRFLAYSTVGHQTTLPPNDSPMDTYRKIIAWPETLVFPEEVHLSYEAEDLIRQLLCGAQHRLKGQHVKGHTFFRGLDWENLRRMRAPFIPQLTSITDTSYFPTDEFRVHDVNDMDGVITDEYPSLFSNLAFLGYTYRRWDTVRENL